MTVPYTFGTESSPIPLSQLDANFAVLPAFANTAGNVSNAAQPNITSVGTLTSLDVDGSVTAGNLLTSGSVSSTGNLVAGNISTGGVISAYGTITGGNISTGANITGNVITATSSIITTGNVSGGNVNITNTLSTTGNILAQGTISAVGNVQTDQYFIGNFQGNITGNLSVGGSNTQVLFNNNGNVGAAGGLTYNSGSNTLGILGVVSAQGNITGGNLRVNGLTTLVGVATAPTAAVNTANNQVATTAFVNNQISAFQTGTLGTISTQNANNVSITGGNISGLSNIGLSNSWSITANSSALLFSFDGNNVAKLDSSGNFTAIGNVTGFGTL